ncbi:alpha/beta hydrolase [Bacillus timonensis]|nr:alpha/beta hydrolase [Bacillus timonensis]
MRDQSISTINRTIQTALLIDGFWERWLVHGINQEDINSVRKNLISLDHWTSNWKVLADQKKMSAATLEKLDIHAAEEMYRKASLYYYLNYWIFPSKNEEKEKWYQECLDCILKADTLSSDIINYPNLDVGEGKCVGRVRVPKEPKGCIILVVPIDSSKEELFVYEEDFTRAGYVTITFDGPGQGGTYTQENLLGNREKWEQFIELSIQYTKNRFKDLPLYLFGTSLGASWALYGSIHPAISKTVAVSPAVEFEKLHLPSYFIRRMSYSNTLLPGKRAFPDLFKLDFQSPILLFHGKKDLMVQTSDMYRLYDLLPKNNRDLIEYENEGHCCNNKLSEIRKVAIDWFNKELVSI